MRKFYSLITVLIASYSFAQGSVNFEGATISSSYSDGSFQEGTTTVTYVHSRNEGLGSTDNYSIDGKGIMLRRADEPSSVTFSIPSGVGEFRFQYRKAFTGGSVRQLAVVVNGEEILTEPFGEGSGANATVYTFTTPIEVNGATSIKITYPTDTAVGNRQVTIDNVQWSAYGQTLSTIDYNIASSNTIQNTIWSDLALFSTKSNTKVEVFNTSGQLVKTFEVNGNKQINVSDLATGVYIVNSTENGKTVSTKIIKK